MGILSKIITIIHLSALIFYNMPLYQLDGVKIISRYDSFDSNENSNLSFIESIPVDMKYENSSEPIHQSTYEAWKMLLTSAKSSIKIASMYWSLLEGDVNLHPDAAQGRNIYKYLTEAGKMGVDIKIVQNKPSTLSNQSETENLQNLKIARVRSLDFDKILGGGVLHTKFILVDDAMAYIGSANMDWRSLTQVKELGILVSGKTIARDLRKIFDTYWLIGERNKVPDDWPEKLYTYYNDKNPLTTTINGILSNVYLSSSPKEFCPPGRNPDIDAILSVISRAKKYIKISVMTYIPTTLYSKRNYFWPKIDDALRAAAIDKHVNVKLLIGFWNHTTIDEITFLKSLSILNGSHSGLVKIEIKKFVVPTSASEADIPYARVNHAKFMSTDGAAYVGTSNWSADYFINTAGVGFVMKRRENSSNNDIVSELEGIFDRDWFSEYAKEWI